MKKYNAIGVASGVAAANPGCAQGALVLENSNYFQQLLQQQGIVLTWAQVFPTLDSAKLKTVAAIAEQVASKTYEVCSRGEVPFVFGGDHSCAIGTWSGVSAALRPKGDLGLIWIDAHLDAHTPETSETGNIHGMPVAALLGLGAPVLTQIMGDPPKIKPEHLCYIGIRSYEAAERQLLERLGVKIFYSEDVLRRGMEVVMEEALRHVQCNTVGFGVSIDIDSIDPRDAPGTGTPVEEGIRGIALCKALTQLAGLKTLVGIEIAEFDPQSDIDQKTEKLIGELIVCLINPKKQSN